MLEVQSLKPDESVLCFTVFPSQGHWQSQKGPKTMSGISLLHSLSFALSSLAVIAQTGLSVQTFTHTLVQQSLA